jgi:penicillin-binding protein 2
MRKAIAESCDVYYYILSGGYKDIKGLGINKIDEYLINYRFGKETGIDLPGEEPGFVPTPEWKEEEKGIVWYPGDTYNISIGQGFLKATPLQVLTAISTIANNGKLITPQIVRGVVDNNQSIVEYYDNDIESADFISKENIKVVQEGMRQTVISENGTAYSLSYLSEDFAAKTGTAETGTGSYHNWIVVYGPYENPDIAMIVLAENIPTSSGITNRIAYEILDYYYNIDKEENN